MCVVPEKTRIKHSDSERQLNILHETWASFSTPFANSTDLWLQFGAP